MSNPQFNYCYGDLLGEGCQAMSWSTWICLVKKPIGMTTYDAVFMLTSGLSFAIIVFLCFHAERVRALVAKTVVHNSNQSELSSLQGLLTSGALPTHYIGTLSVAIFVVGLWIEYILGNYSFSTQNEGWGYQTPRSWFWIFTVSSPTLILNLMLVNLHGNTAQLPAWYRNVAYALHTTTLAGFIVLLSSHLRNLIALMGFAFTVVIIQSIAYIPFTLLVIAQIGWGSALAMSRYDLHVKFAEAARALATRHLSFLPVDATRVLIVEPSISKSIMGLWGLALVVGYPVVHLGFIGVLGGVVRAVANQSLYAYESHFNNFVLPTLMFPVNVLQGSRVTILSALLMPWTLREVQQMLNIYFVFAPHTCNVPAQSLLASVTSPREPGGGGSTQSPQHRVPTFLTMLAQVVAAGQVAALGRLWGERNAFIYTKRVVDAYSLALSMVVMLACFVPLFAAYWEHDMATYFDGWTYFSTPLLCPGFVWDAIQFWPLSVQFGELFVVFVFGVVMWVLSSAFATPITPISELTELAQVLACDNPSLIGAVIRQATTDEGKVRGAADLAAAESAAALLERCDRATLANAALLGDLDLIDEILSSDEQEHMA